MPMMNYSKMKKPGPMITKRFGMLAQHASVSTWSGTTLELYNRTKFKDGKGYDDTNLLGTVDIGRADAYGCIPLTVHMNTHLEAADYKEIFTAIMQALQGVDKARMVQVNKADAALTEALTKMKFQEDLKDAGCMLWTGKKYNWVALYMLLGIAIGLFIGEHVAAIGATLGIIIGAILGGLVGWGHTKKDNQKFADMLAERAAAPEEPEQTTAEEPVSPDSEE